MKISALFGGKKKISTAALKLKLLCFCVCVILLLNYFSFLFFLILLGSNVIHFRAMTHMDGIVGTTLMPVAG